MMYQVKRMQRGLCMLLILAIALLALCPVSANAASSTRKCYTISRGNTTVYSDTGLTNRYGTIYDSDEITVLTVTDTYCRVRYPISGNRTKVGYISTACILTGTIGNIYFAREQVTTYKRPDGGVYGYISAGDSVTMLGNYGSYTQIKYPVSGGFKYAFIRSEDAQRYIYATGEGMVADGLYQISTAMDANMLMDIYGNNIVDYSNIQLCQNNGGNNQKFYIRNVGAGWYTITSAANDQMAVDVQGGESRSDVNVHLYHINNTDAQLWRFESAGDGYYYIQSKLGYYLDVSGAVSYDEANIIVYEKNGGSNQRWKLTKIGESSATVPTVSYRQQAMADQAIAMLGNRDYNGYCQRFVRVVSEKIGVISSSGATSALDACNKWRVSTSQEDIPIGACVYLRSKNTSSAGYKFGHVGIHIGDGNIVHAISTVKMQSLSSMMSSYTYLGWGWQGGVDLR